MLGIFSCLLLIVYCLYNYEGYVYSGPLLIFKLGYFCCYLVVKAFYIFYMEVSTNTVCKFMTYKYDLWNDFRVSSLFTFLMVILC